MCKYLRKGWMVIIFLFSGFISFSQTEYTAGISEVSIQPSDSIFSLSMPGYGLPEERYTLTWHELGAMSSIQSFTASNGWLYVLDKNNTLYRGNQENGNLHWNVMEAPTNLETIAATGDTLYGIQRNKTVISGTIKNGKIKWTHEGETDRTTVLTSFKGKLVEVVDDKVMVGTPGKSGIEWIENGEADSAISLAGKGNRLYKLNADNTIWYKYDTSPDWIKVARQNGETYTIDARHIAIMDDRLYATDTSGKIYVGANADTQNKLTATAIAISDSHKTVVIVGVDLCGFTGPFINNIKERLKKIKNLDPSAVLINASHTHYAPLVRNWHAMGDFYQQPDSCYLNLVTDNIIKSVEIAIDNMTPVDLSFMRTTTNIGLNRRKNANPEAPNNNTLDIIKIANKDQTVNSLLFSTGCHPVFKNAGAESYTISANFPGITRDFLMGELGVKSVFIQGCAGDINPVSDNYEKTGTQLAHDITTALNNIESPVPLLGQISFFLDTINVPVKAWSVKEIKQIREEALDNKEDLHARNKVRWSSDLLQHYKTSKPPKTMTVFVQTINIGNWKLVGLSREVVTAYGPEIRNLWPEKNITVAGYCNDVPSYLPDDWHVDKQLYEGYSSFFWYGAPALFPSNVLDIVVKNIKKNNR